MKSCCGLQIPFTALTLPFGQRKGAFYFQRGQFVIWPRVVIIIGVREFMGCNGIIHSIHQLSFSSSDRLCIVCISRKGPQVISSQSYTEKLSKRRNKAVWSSIARFFKAMNSSSRSYRKAGFLAIFKHSTCNVMKFRRPF